MTPQEFIAKWQSVELKERSASQSHFNDLCRLLGLPDRTAADYVSESPSISCARPRSCR